MDSYSPKESQAIKNTFQAESLSGNPWALSENVDDYSLSYIWKNFYEGRSKNVKSAPLVIVEENPTMFWGLSIGGTRNSSMLGLHPKRQDYGYNAVGTSNIVQLDEQNTSAIRIPGKSDDSSPTKYKRKASINSIPQKRKYVQKDNRRSVVRIQNGFEDTTEWHFLAPEDYLKRYGNGSKDFPFEILEDDSEPEFELTENTNANEENFVAPDNHGLHINKAEENFGTDGNSSENLSFEIIVDENEPDLRHIWDETLLSNELSANPNPNVEGEIFYDGDFDNFGNNWTNEVVIPSDEDD